MVATLKMVIKFAHWNVEDLVTFPMGLLPDTQNYGLRRGRECQGRFRRHRGLTTATCITR